MTFSQQGGKTESLTEESMVKLVKKLWSWIK